MDGFDRPLVLSLAQVEQPSDADVVQAARLVMRYRDSRLSPDLMGLLAEALQRWSIDCSELFSRARSLWQAGLGAKVTLQAEQVGSGADVEG